MARAASATQFDLSASNSQKAHPALPVFALGWSLSAFFSISYVLCVLGYHILPQLPVVHGALSIFLPGFQFQSWPRFILGLVESLAWGWYIALIFGPLYNVFATRARGAR